MIFFFRYHYKLQLILFIKVSENSYSLGFFLSWSQFLITASQYKKEIFFARVKAT